MIFKVVKWMARKMPSPVIEWAREHYRYWKSASLNQTEVLSISLNQADVSIGQSERGIFPYVPSDRVSWVHSAPIQDPEALARSALVEAYAGREIPTGSMNLLKSADKPGQVCCVFFFGRSGSYFLQSFFDQFPHPRVISFKPPALVSFDDVISQHDIDRYNSANRPNGTPSAAQHQLEWVDNLLARFPESYSRTEGQAGVENLHAPLTPFSKLIYAQFVWLCPAELTWERLLKIFFVAYRLSRGQAVDCTQPLTYLWAAHTPGSARKAWIKRTFPNSRLLTVVRFPEKALDSHLIHHTFEFISPPLLTLFRRLCFEFMATSVDLTDGSVDGSEIVVRFEDIHHHAAFVLQAICGWLNVPYDDRLLNASFEWSVRGQAVVGVRRLTKAEFEPRMLNTYDVLKIRFLLQENYRLWGYDRLCDPSFEGSLAKYERDEVVRTAPFAANSIIAELSGETREASNHESRLILERFFVERARRDAGVSITPLLYSLHDLPQTNPQFL